jgi:hypothetical protein
MQIRWDASKGRPVTYLAPQQIEQFYPGLKASRLARWRWAKTGPRYTKAGRSVLYTRADIEAFLEAHAVSAS